jgi:glutaminyl-peptide cyclotransferase
MHCTVRRFILVLACVVGSGSGNQVFGDLPPTAIRFDAKRAYNYLVKVCRIGTRVSGTTGMARQQQMIIEHFAKMKCEVKYQPFEAVHPLNGTPVRMNNIIVSWHPQTTERILIACHYDTRPMPDRDPVNRHAPFIGANDGASGVAFFMELGHHMHRIKPKYGVDFVFFDGEELVYGDRGKYFLGSEHFARRYRDGHTKHKYVAGVLLDMLGDRRLNVYYEKNSWKMAPRVSKSLFDAAAQVGVREFVPRIKHEVQDDHLPLNQIAGIPTCDLIDFDYRYWHTSNDIPANCSGESLAKVGLVITHWLNTGPMIATK